jgi:hypothetical protein
MASTSSALTPSQDLIWTGSYTADAGGSGLGIGAVSAAPDGTLRWLGVAAEAQSGSPWLVVNSARVFRREGPVALL